jgi:hypothetical protein
MWRHSNTSCFKRKHFKLHIGMPYCGKWFWTRQIPACRLSWFLYTLNIYAHFSSHFSQQLLMAEIWYLVTGSRNLTGPKTLPTIWYTYMKLVTKNQISAINSYWEKCNEKYLGRTEGQTDRGKTVYLAKMNRYLVGSANGRFRIEFPQSRMKGERHRLSSVLSL